MQAKTGKTIKLSELRLTDGSKGLKENPRLIKDARFKWLCESIKRDPEYMIPRPIVVAEDGYILAGSMRWRACRELGMVEIPVAWVSRVKGWSIEKKNRFIVADNTHAGLFDDDLLANEWEMKELQEAGYEAGLTVPDFKAEEEDCKTCPTCGKKIKCPT